MKKSNKFTQTCSSVFNKFTDNVGLQHFIKGTSSRSIEPFLKDKEMLDKTFEQAIGADKIIEWLVACQVQPQSIILLNKLFDMAIKSDQILLDSYYTEVLILGLHYTDNLHEQNIWIITDKNKSIQTKVQTFTDIIDVITSNFKKLNIK